jgi:hypothetical protein
VDGFKVALVRFPPLLRLPLHTHERATVAVVLSGSFDGLMRRTSHRVFRLHKRQFGVTPLAYRKAARQ